MSGRDRDGKRKTAENRDIFQTFDCRDFPIRALPKIGTELPERRGNLDGNIFLNLFPHTTSLEARQNIFEYNLVTVCCCIILFQAYERQFCCEFFKHIIADPLVLKHGG